MTYKAIIVDDEPMARTLLSAMLAEYCLEVEVVELCPDLPHCVKSIRKHKPDIVFLDIEMPGHSGLELLDFFDEDDVDFSIVFVTAYNQYAIQAFKLAAVDYLLKPIEADDLRNAMQLVKKNRTRQRDAYDALRENLGSAINKKLAINTMYNISFVDTKDILYFEGDGAYTKVVLDNGKTITSSKGLKSFETLLADNASFFRCHKSYIVNLQHVSDYAKGNGGYLILDQKQEISVSADKLDTLLRRIAQNP